GSSAAAELGGGAPRAAPARGDAAAAVGGASRCPPGRLWLQPFLRALSRLGGATVADHAAEPRRRRAPVRRLRRHDAHGDRRVDRRGEDAAGVRRRARRVELHLCRGHLDAGPVRLDRLATAGVCLHGRARAMVVSDNLRPGITKACFYEPAVNRTYAEMAAHYNTAIVPARPYRARDKAKVEVAVGGHLCLACLK